MSVSVLFLINFFFVGMAIAKVNKDKLKRMMDKKDDVTINLGKRHKPNSSSKRMVEEVAPRPLISQEPIVSEQAPALSVELVEPPNAPSSSKAEKAPTLPNDAFLALRRAKSVVTKEDMDEYGKLNTDVVKRALAHSLMKVEGYLFFLFRCLYLLMFDFVFPCFVGFDQGYGHC